METLIIWVVLVSLLLINIALRIENKKLKARLMLQRDPDEPLVFIKNQMAQHKGRIEAIKALRQHYPELSLIEATQLWQTAQSSNLDEKQQ